tara:strand:+ start:839 stop:1444 length:606 start_codon:yes stop_codon:yes gene_type:complete
MNQFKVLIIIFLLINSFSPINAIDTSIYLNSGYSNFRSEYNNTFNINAGLNLKLVENLFLQTQVGFLPITRKSDNKSSTRIPISLGLLYHIEGKRITPYGGASYNLNYSTLASSSFNTAIGLIAGINLKINSDTSFVFETRKQLSSNSGIVYPINMTVGIAFKLKKLKSKRKKKNILKIEDYKEKRKKIKKKLKIKYKKKN